MGSEQVGEAGQRKAYEPEASTAIHVTGLFGNKARGPDVHTIEPSCGVHAKREEGLQEGTSANLKQLEKRG
jgi:hypothetical protein